jgi:hypothetical protein
MPKQSIFAPLQHYKALAGAILASIPAMEATIFPHSEYMVVDKTKSQAAQTGKAVQDRWGRVGMISGGM